MGAVLPTPPEDVLSTLNSDGTRRWLRPRVSVGRFLAARRIVAWALVVLFVALPFLRVRGQPAVLFDIARWRLTLLGKMFLPSDTILLAVLLVGFVVALFFLTAVLGRVWCGWACPQTVYMEFLFRPIERFFDGKPKRGGALGREISGPRLFAKYVAYGIVSVVLANVFLGYFVGVSSLHAWMTESPARHPMAFFVMAFTSALVFFDFAWFREQTCIVACPYGRLQSVLLDRDSLVVGYDPRRGEPRGARRSARTADGTARGDCVDCRLCVDTCPTGIDIRDGLRMECIACAQCIDACDAVMTKIHRPRGLIGYGSQLRREQGWGRLARPRVWIYGSVLLGIAAFLGVMLRRSPDTDVILLRGLGHAVHGAGQWRSRQSSAHQDPQPRERRAGVFHRSRERRTRTHLARRRTFARERRRTGHARISGRGARVGLRRWPTRGTPACPRRSSVHQGHFLPVARAARTRGHMNAPAKPKSWRWPVAIVAMLCLHATGMVVVMLVATHESVVFRRAQSLPEGAGLGRAVGASTCQRRARMEG